MKLYDYPGSISFQYGINIFSFFIHLQTTPTEYYNNNITRNFKICQPCSLKIISYRSKNGKLPWVEIINGFFIYIIKIPYTFFQDVK